MKEITLSPFEVEDMCEHIECALAEMRDVEWEDESLLFESREGLELCLRVLRPLAPVKKELDTDSYE